MELSTVLQKHGFGMPHHI